MYSILRTTFYFLHDIGTWTQVVHSRCRLRWSSCHVHTLQDCKDGVKSLLDSLRWEDSTDFSQPPVWFRLFISTNNAIASRLSLVIHHSLYDGLSIGKLFAAVERLYRGDPLSPPTQFHTLLPDIFYQETEGTSFWLKRLQGFHPAPLPDPRLSTSRVICTVTKDIVISSSHLSILANAGVTIRCLFQAAVAKLLASLTGFNDVVFGHVVSGRGIANSEDVIGPMLVSTRYHWQRVLCSRDSRTASPVA